MAIYELRTYTLVVGKLNEAVELYTEIGWPALKPYQDHLVGYFTGDIGALNQIVHLWKFEDDANRREDGRVDAHAQLMDELGEEVGLDRADISRVRHLGLIHDARDGVSELAFELTCRVDFEVVRARHAALETREYSQVRWLPLDTVRAYLLEAPGGTTPVTEALLGLIGA